MCAGSRLVGKTAKEQGCVHSTDGPLSKHLVKVTGRKYTVQVSQTFREKLIKALKEQG